MKPSYILIVTLPDGQVLDFRIWGVLNRRAIDLLRRYLDLVEESLDDAALRALDGTEGQ